MSTWRPIEPTPLWQRCLPTFLHTPVIIFFKLSITGLLVGGAFAFFYFLLAMRFDLSEVEKLPLGTTFYDNQNLELSAPGSSGRKLVVRADIPDFLVKSLQAREDARFFEHSGIDVRGLARATLRNLKDRKFTQGASTLTMQLARNSFKITQKSLHRKFLEIALTLRIENHFSKDEILTHYLNRIYFGAGASGIEQAAQTYFGKSTRDLSPGECSLIVGIIRGPHIFSPFRDLDAALEQRSQTLNRMVAMNLITPEQRTQIQQEPVVLVPDEKRETQTSYALQAIRRELDSILDTLEIPSSGLKVYSTISTAWQNRLEQELNVSVNSLEAEKSWPHPTLSKYQASAAQPNYIQFAAITTEAKSGAILALIGGRNYSHSKFDRTRSTRDLGSAFEPFVAAAASERGKLVLPGKPVQTGRQIGPAEVERITKRCGLSGPFLPTEDLFRGSVAATPLEMSVALATIGNQGRKPTPFLIQEIRDPSGEVIYQAKPQLSQAISAPAAADAVSILKRKGSTRTFIGATGSERDAWTLRIGPSGATAIWIGFDQPSPITSEPRLNALLEEFVKRLENN